MNIYLKSILEQISQQIWDETDLEKAKKIAVDHLQQSKVDEDDKKDMVKEIQNQTKKYKLDFYIANALLKYEGYGLSKYKKEK